MTFNCSSHVLCIIIIDILFIMYDWSTKFNTSLWLSKFTQAELPVENLVISLTRFKIGWVARNNNVWALLEDLLYLNQLWVPYPIIICNMQSCLRLFAMRWKKFKGGFCGGIQIIPANLILWRYFGIWSLIRMTSSVRFSIVSMVGTMILGYL